MSTLEQFYKEIEAEDWDRSVESCEELKKRFQEKKDELQEKGANEEARKLEAEREALVFIKHVGDEKGDRLEPLIRRKVERTGQEEKEHYHDLPDIKAWGDQDFEWVLDRFRSTENNFLKTEYGLFLYCAEELKHDKDIEALLDALMDLAERHYQNHKEQENEGTPKDRFALLHYTDTLRDALYIARERKKNEGVRPRYEELLRQLAQAHERLDLEKEEERNYLFHLTDMAITFSKDAKEQIDLKAILEKNRKAVEHYREEEASYGIELAKLCEDLSNKIGEPSEGWVRYQAEAYEALAEKDKEGPRNFVAVRSIQMANSLYRKLKDPEGMERTGQEYARLRPEARKGLQQFKEEAPEEESREIHEKLHREAHDKDPEEVVKDFVRCPMFSPVEVIQEEVNEQLKAPPIHFYSQGHIPDKFGNSVEIYPSRSEAYLFWQSYGLHFQVGAQLLVRFFKEALHAGTLDEGVTIGILEGTWLNEMLQASAHPDPSVVPLDLIRPCLKSFFRELEGWKADEAYEPDLISLTDSLTLKVEAMVRYLCYRTGIETFKVRNKGGSQEEEIVMERSLDELLYELKELDAFWKSDHYFIKFLMTHRMGLNLRNKVAHGLLDANEYTLEKPVLAFTTLMRLSKYQFNEKEKDS